MTGHATLQHVLSAKRLRGFQRLLLRWHAQQARALPWRDSPSPYQVLVSEIMLQQTQAARVATAFPPFIARFPTAGALAAAPRADVLRQWRGLGYNRRAVNLHSAAQALVSDHHGRVPDDLVSLRRLPGVGEYSARAVLAFAYGRDVAPVDTNVARVVQRAIAGEPLRGRALQEAADAAVARGHGSAWSSALMDLGSAHCRARNPGCDSCPVRRSCAWDAGRAVADPAARPRPARSPAAFPGSDRFHRGRLLDALRAGPVPTAEVAAAAQLATDPARAQRLTRRLMQQGLADSNGTMLRLPG